MTRLSTILALMIALCAPTAAQTERVPGTYAADLPSASGCGRRVLLELFTDDSYLFVQRYLCRPWTDAQATAGTWKVQGDRVILSSIGEDMRFSIRENGLSYQGTRFGESGLHLEQLR